MVGHGLKVLVGLMFLVMTLAARPCRALSVQFAHGESPRPEQWELLGVRFEAPPGGGTLSVRDARGGLVVTRAMSAGTVDAASGKTRLLVPLPFVGAADLPVGDWPVVVTITSAGGAVTRENVAVARPSAIGALGGENRSFRVIVVGGSGGEGGGSTNPHGVSWQEINPAPPLFVEMSEEEVLSGPPLLFASCDALLLTDRVAGRLSGSADRVAAILAAGVEIVSVTDPAKSQGVLGHLPWRRVGMAGVANGAWVTPPPAMGGYPRPQVLEAGLNRVRGLRAWAKPGGATSGWVIAVPLLAITVVVLARGLFRRTWLVLLVAAVGLCGLTWGVCAGLRSSAPPVARSARWVSGRANAHAQAAERGTALWIKESFSATSSLFGERRELTADENGFLYPVAASAREYFALEHATLLLDASVREGLSQRGSRLELVTGPRERVVYAARSAALRPLPDLSADGVQGAAGEWLENGYIHAARGAEGGHAGDTEGMLVTQWAAEHTEVADSLLAWYEMRFAAGRRYFLMPVEKGEGLRLIDFGAAE